MEAEIISVRENPLLERRKVKVKLEHEGEETPSEEDVISRVAAENDLETEEMEVLSIYTGYGSNISEATLNIFQEFEYSENLEKDPAEEQGEEVEVTAEYEEIVSGTITDAKNALNEMDSPDYEAALQAEKDNKNRATLIDWLESQ